MVSKPKKIFFIVLGFFFLLLASFPYLFSFKPILHFYLQTFKKEIKIESASFSWLGPQVMKNLSYKNAFFFQADKVKAHMNFIEFIFAKDLVEYSKMSIENGKLTVFDQTLEKIDARYDLNKKTFSLKGFKKKGSLSLEGQIQSLNTMDLILQTRNFPTLLADKLLDYFKIEKKITLTELLGAVFNLNMNIDLKNRTGPVHIQLNSPKMQGIIPSYFKNSEIFLTDPLSLQFHVTENLSKTLLKEFNPIVVSAVHSKTPMRLIISQKNFSFPLDGDPKKIRIDFGTIDFGVFQARTRDNLSNLFQLLQMPSGNITTIRSTPMDFQIQKGNLKADRADFLLSDRIHICTWGQVNLSTGYVQMTLGILGNTINRTLNSNLPNDYVMTIPIKGTTEKWKIDTSYAKGKIVALLATKFLPEEFAQFGKLFHQIEALESQKNIPPPKYSIPWY